MLQGNNNKLHPANSQTTCWLQVARGYRCTGDTTMGPRFGATPQAGSTIRSVVTSRAGCSGAPETRQMLGREKETTTRVRASMGVEVEV